MSDMPEESPSPSLRPNKRTRGLSDVYSSGCNAFFNDVSLWFRDGNVVLLAGDVAFRVHQGVLSRHSETFRGLFTIPQPDDAHGDETVDGCPLIPVHDSAHDFKHLLHALYDGLDTYVHSRGPIKFGTLAALMRLSHKYQIDRIHAATLDLVKTIVPFDFKTWQHREGKRESSSAAVKFKDTDAIEAYNLLRICGRAELLPPALYMCCAVEVRLLLRGVTRADGTLEKLSDGDLERCLVARDALTLRNATLNRSVFNLGNPSREPCRAPKVCLANMHKVGATAGLGTLHETEARRAFQRLLTIASAPAICEPCVAFIHSNRAKFLEGLWRDLPQILDLPVSNWPPATTA